ncbi:hypothetical protein DV515_00018725, partial [Chloebia gouldiae]
KASGTSTSMARALPTAHVSPDQNQEQKCCTHLCGHAPSSHCRNPSGLGKRCTSLPAAHLQWDPP